MHDIRVIACVIQRDSQFLLCQRPAHKRHGGMWEFPGGKVEPGESDLGAARRELAEELDVHVTAMYTPTIEVRDHGSPFVIAFVPFEILGEPRCIDHADMQWLHSRAMQDVALAPADKAFAQWLADSHLLFSYGSLQLPRVQLANYGRELVGTPDQLPGFNTRPISFDNPELVTLTGTTSYSIAFETGGTNDLVDGVALEVTGAELLRTDSYEGAEYTRRQVTLASGRSAWAYVDG